jgi:ribosome-binding factor A
MAVKNRVFKVNELIKREVGNLISREIEFPENTLATITRVETSSNLIQSKIYISVIPENQIIKVVQILNQRVFDIQKEIDKRLRMRPVPKIIFAEEKETEKADKVEELLEKIKNN